MDRAICIHGHFYQPPRENPWLEAIELQDSAYPYHDWNDRITAECYAPNAAARIFDADGRIATIASNYARISFNVGPTLLAWMETDAFDVYEAILAADEESRRRFGGHGSALAQAYGHLIMPLANRRDKQTQIIWGLADFERRFGRPAEGMWLPETAVDLETLDLLALHGVGFTILAPHQAHRVRELGSRQWHDVDGARIDPTMAYRVALPSGRSMALFFYDGPISRAVAFEGLLSSGERLAHRLAEGFDNRRDRPQLVHIATDGETYGHHHRHGDMALAYALEHLEGDASVRLTNYGEFLERCPPTHEVEIHEDTSWSCAHGVERWRDNCGCRTRGDYGQEWRGPLRDALDHLRDRVAPAFEVEASRLLADPWRARDEYIEVVLDRATTTVDAFLARHGRHPLEPIQQVRALKLLELQRHAMSMYTSCGWFFDEISGIEATQVLQYAGRVVQLSAELLGDDPEDDFLQRLAKARSNVPEMGDGRAVYDRAVRPSMVDLPKLGAHYGASSLFEDYPERIRLFCYDAHAVDYQLHDAGRARLAVGKVALTSRITREVGTVSFAALHLGDHNLNAGVRPFLGENAYQAMRTDVVGAFRRADFPEVVRRLDHHFGASPYSLRTLFRDEQRRVLEQILDNTIAGTEETLRHLYEDHAPLMRFLADLGTPIPKTLRTTAELVLNAQLRDAFRDEQCDDAAVRTLFTDTADWGLELDVEGLAYTMTQTIEGLAERLGDHPADLVLVERLQRLVDLAHSLPWEVDLWRTQNAFYGVLRGHHDEARRRAAAGDAAAREWLVRIRGLGAKLSVAVP